MFNKPEGAPDVVDLASTDWKSLATLGAYPELVRLRTALTAAGVVHVRLLDENIALGEQLESRTLSGREQLAAHDRREQLRRLILEAESVNTELRDQHDSLRAALEAAFLAWVDIRPGGRNHYVQANDRPMSVDAIHKQMRTAARTPSRSGMRVVGK